MQITHSIGSVIIRTGNKAVPGFERPGAIVLGGDVARCRVLRPAGFARRPQQLHAQIWPWPGGRDKRGRVKLKRAFQFQTLQMIINWSISLSASDIFELPPWLVNKPYTGEQGAVVWDSGQGTSSLHTLTNSKLPTHSHTRNKKHSHTYTHSSTQCCEEVNNCISAISICQTCRMGEPSNISAMMQPLPREQDESTLVSCSMSVCHTMCLHVNVWMRKEIALAINQIRTAPTTPHMSTASE